MLLYNIYIYKYIYIIIIDTSTERRSCAVERSSGGEKERGVGDNL